jgi:hypothetical protein
MWAEWDSWTEMAGFHRAMNWSCFEGPAATLARTGALPLQYERAGPLRYEVPAWFDPDTYEGLGVPLEDLGIDLSLHDEREWRKGAATGLTMTQALERWPPTRFRGLGLDFVVLASPAGPRSIVGSLWWKMRRASDGRHHHHVSVEYPSRSHHELADVERWLLALRQALEGPPS